MGDMLHHQIWTLVSLHLHDEANHMWEVSNAAIFFGLMFWLDPIRKCVWPWNMLRVWRIRLLSKDVTLSKLLLFFPSNSFLKILSHLHQTFLSCVLTKIPGGSFV